MHQIVIPAFDEEARLPRTLRELRRHVVRSRALLGPVEVIVVDNASTDATARVAAEADSDALPVRVVACATRGKGAAVRAGLLATTAPTVSFMDADGATRLDALDRALRLLADGGVDVVVGSRAIAGAETEARHSRVRDRGARAYRACAARIVPGIADTQCGFKVLRGDLARAIAAELESPGFAFDVELLARALAHGARLHELPVWWVDVPGSTFDPVRHGVDSFAELARIAWRARRGGFAPVVVPLPARPLAPVPPVAATLGLPTRPAVGLELPLRSEG
ncbi:glycosyltransferase [Nocardioides sp. TRM66260-LWL]|uniref:glycosyltransferase n=1 Tax=Nocardioides sp. TRM66260-LWL TaxID=2874478 RepID=UPI001CC41299|nr:glycosyltransferase [Nocardioides sp. TRM66260-LWL]MBZ5733693.1 glycosyltransferase [Nocardioides sp. TRM66260-LWL]